MADQNPEYWPRVGDKIWIVPLLDPDGNTVGYAWAPRKGYANHDPEELVPVDMTNTGKNNKIIKRGK